MTPQQQRVFSTLRDLVYAIEIPSHLSVGLRAVKPFAITVDGEAIQVPERIITDAEAEAWEENV